ncbi:hypothetical protein E4U60_005547 [Claviceps pazoutovae]|uniref:Uncharacterized protein n=1 Tax=Claviceps pazoutovae TaxID=1649127 RepID=A0A9P7M7K0_9HYPO|nr:hypothetical protein E4U60_005547 [Claviceps pazoutovae]
MDANTNPDTQPGLRQPDFATVADISRGFAEQMERCRNLPAVHDGAQWAELSGRMGGFERQIEKLDSKVQNLDSKIQHLDTNIQRLEAKVDDRMGALETKVGALETKVGALETKVGALETKVGALETEIKTLQTKMTTLETNIINKLDTFMALMTARSTEMDEKFLKCNIKIDAV